jgi:pimeloyl-ACP methyl ester carboxylesterase
MGYSSAVILNAGPERNEATWDVIAEPIGKHAIVRIIQPGERPLETAQDLESEVRKIHALIEAQAMNDCTTQTFILVGVGTGNEVNLIVAAQQPELVTGLVVIDPGPNAPGAHAGSVSAPAFSTLHHDEIEIPSTVIFPSRTSPDINDSIQRLTNRREIIAGRSNSDVLQERPDVVIDAILAFLDPNFSRT